MGYNVYVTRANGRSEATPISTEEWLGLVDATPDLQLRGSFEATSPSGEVIRMRAENLAEWLAHPERHPILFDFRRGEVVVSNPDSPTIERMKLLATQLHASVVGEEGESYA